MAKSTGSYSNLFTIPTWPTDTLGTVNRVFVFAWARYANRNWRSLAHLGEEVQISRSWLRQVLRHSSIAQQVIILDCPGADTLADWLEDLQISAEQGQCLIAAASPFTEPERFAQALLETLSAADFQTGLSVAGWIAQLQQALSGAAITPHVWLSGTQGPD